MIKVYSLLFIVFTELPRPLERWLRDEPKRKILFFLSLYLAVATRVLLAFREDDTHAADTMLAKKR